MKILLYKRNEVLKMFTCADGSVSYMTSIDVSGHIFLNETVYLTESKYFDPEKHNDADKTQNIYPAKQRRLNFALGERCLNAWDFAPCISETTDSEIESQIRIRSNIGKPRSI